MKQLVLSLFPGLELLDQAFREQGFCVVAGPDKLLGGDIRDFHPPGDRFDGVIGGSPCQAFSALANVVRAKGLEPRFGNLVPEFERVVSEAAPAWFLHENVLRAPVPKPPGYAVQDFELCNSSIEGEDGMGQEQERVRRFTFGVRGAAVAPNLLRWIPRAALRLPAAARVGGAVSEPVNNSAEAKGRVRTHTVQGGNDETPGNRVRTSAVLADQRAVPVALGGSGKPKRSRYREPPLSGEHGIKQETPRLRQGAVTHDTTEGRRDQERRLRRAPIMADQGSGLYRKGTITGANAGERPRGGKSERRTIAEMLRLQGLSEDLLDEAPFTAKAKRRLIANGVPMPMGRAVAEAVVKALEHVRNGDG